MLLSNDTPFAALGFGDLHRDGMTMAVVAVRAAYNLGADGALQLTNRQEMVLNDIFEGDPQRTVLIQVGDLIPFKPGVDITVVGAAHAPAGRPVSSWDVGIAVGDHKARLRVHGPRQWEPTLRLLKPTWRLGQASRAVTVPLDYRFAAGGRYAGDPDGNADLRNPIGPGLLHPDWTPAGRALRAPQIESIDAPIAEPFETTVPRGFAPLPPWWRDRQGFAGTYDEDWRRERHPRLPEDFDYRFYQTAHPSLVVSALRGNEIVQLDRLTPNEKVTFALPDLTPVIDHRWFDGRSTRARLKLDGLHLDLRVEPWRVDLTWRGWIEQCPAYEGGYLSLASAADVADLPSSGEFGLEEAMT
ncbi:MAG: DUF2169 domain-containing protein [Pseudomonadota bacterium]